MVCATILILLSPYSSLQKFAMCGNPRRVRLAGQIDGRAPANLRQAGCWQDHAGGLFDDLTPSFLSRIRYYDHDPTYSALYHDPTYLDFAAFRKMGRQDAQF